MNSLIAGILNGGRALALGICVLNAGLLWAAPSVTSAPPARTVLVPGQALSLTVEAVGADVSYAWRKDGRLLTGENGSALIRNTVSRADAGCYVAEVRDSSGEVVRVLSFVSVAPSRTQVVSIGFDQHGVGDVPEDLDDAIDIAARQLNVAAIRADGTVKAWGYNFSGQIEPPADLQDVVSVAVGGSHMLALKADGTVVAWGSNDYGESSVPDGLREVIDVAAGSAFSLALRADGTVVGWGADDSYYGRLEIPEGLSGVVAISAGGAGAMALKADGSVVAWGDNNYERAIPDDLGAVVSIAAGRGGFGDPYWLALRADGTVTAWGTAASDAQHVPAGLQDIVEIAADGDLGAARAANGSVRVWGNAQVVGMIPAEACVGVQAVALGSAQYYALRDAAGDTTPRVLVQPAGVTLDQGADLSLRVVASGSGSLTYQWRHNGVAIPGATGASYFREEVRPAQGGYYDVVVRNQSGRTTSVRAEVVVQLIEPVRLSTVQEIYVSTRIYAGVVADPSPTAGARYFVNGLPAGLKLNPKTGEVTGRITGKPGTYVVTYYYTVGSYRSPKWTQEIYVFPFPEGVAGSFEAMLFSHDGTPFAKVAVKVARGGAYTGRLVLAEDGKDHAFRGAVDISASHLAIGGNRISRGAARPALLLGFNAMDDDDHPFVASLDAEDGSVLAMEYGVRLQNFPKGAAFLYPGACTALFGPPSSESSEMLPAGIGFAAVKVNARARHEFRGRLADGSLFTASPILGTNDSLRILTRPGGRAGAFFGGVMERDQELEDFHFQATEFSWRKPPRAADSTYPAGFGPARVDVKIARWSTTAGLRDSLGLEANAGSVPLVLAGDGVDQGTIQLLPSAVEILNTGRMLAAAGEPAGGFEGRVDRATGLVSGRLPVIVNGKTRRISFRGAFLQPVSAGAQATMGGGFLFLPSAERGEPARSVELRFGP